MEDWREIYRHCADLYNRQKLPDDADERDRCPKQLVVLQPCTVWSEEDNIWMSWTGGFDDFGLYMIVCQRDGKLPNGSPCSPGIYIIDTRQKSYAHPYDKRADRQM
jgi:hypothetical protein